MTSVVGLARPQLNSLLRASAIVSLTFVAASLCASQTIVNGPRTSGPQPQVHFSGPPTGFSGPPIPTGGPPVPGYNNNYRYHYKYGPYYNGYSGGRGGYGYGGWAYVMPYYYPVDNSAYGYDYVGAGPDLYSGPPIGPNDPLHMIGEQPPVDPYGYGPPPDAEAYAAPPAPAPTAPPAEVKPGEPTVLVFRNGKQQEVTNYAIMGDTLYVFDQSKRKIALADLDIAATVKANDDRGMEFKIPPAAKKKQATPAPQSGKPDQSNDTQPPNIAAVMD
jgi:hypothetical protein